jgi:hypothetical protein
MKLDRLEKGTRLTPPNNDESRWSGLMSEYDHSHFTSQTSPKKITRISPVSTRNAPSSTPEKLAIYIPRLRYSTSSQAEHSPVESSGGSTQVSKSPRATQSPNDGRDPFAISVPIGSNPNMIRRRLTDSSDISGTTITGSQCPASGRSSFDVETKGTVESMSPCHKLSHELIATRNLALSIDWAEYDREIRKHRRTSSTSSHTGQFSPTMATAPSLAPLPWQNDDESNWMPLVY